MSKQETAQDERPVVLEETEQDRRRMQELEDRIAAQGGIEPEAPAPVPRGGVGSARSMIAEATKHLGFRESGENDTKFNRWLGPIQGFPHGGFGYPWCHSFLSFCLAHSNNANAGPRTAGCLSGVAWFKQRGRFSSEPQVGDLVYYGDGGGTHVELVVGVAADRLETIGGNTSGSVDGKTFFNGDGVFRKTVMRTSRIFGYGRPLYGAGGGTGGATVEPLTTVRSIKRQQQAVNKLGFTPKLDVDGEWGPKTEKGVKWLQKKVGAAVDGEWGKETERLFKAFAGS